MRTAESAQLIRLTLAEAGLITIALVGSLANGESAIPILGTAKEPERLFARTIFNPVESPRYRFSLRHGPWFIQRSGSDET